MKSFFFLFLSIVPGMPFAVSQDKSIPEVVKQDLHALINQYTEAREKKDTVLLKNILTADVDQLVSSGEWRNGVKGSIGGMVRSSERNPGTRRLSIEKIRILNTGSAIVDARYEIENPDGTTRKMWSTFIVIQQEGRWKIAAIRNMLPAVPQK